MVAERVQSILVIIVEVLVSFELEFVLLSCNETGSDKDPCKRNKIEKSTRAMVFSSDEDILW